jgi:hypothetical protein
MGHAARKGKMKYAFNILVRAPEGSRQFGETRGNESKIAIITVD